MLTEFGSSSVTMASYDPGSNYLSTASATLSAESAGTLWASSQSTGSNP